LRRLQLPGDVLILAIRRQGELLIPHGTTELEFGDQLSVVGSPGSITEAENIFSMN
jgi:Trk K+ transport system NAD-binding subunit